MPPFLALKFLGLARWAWLLIAAAGLAIVIWRVTAAEKADDKANQAIGATAEREKALTETLERTETAHETRQEVEAQADRGAGDALYRQCLRARNGTPELCQRFLPR